MSPKAKNKSFPPVKVTEEFLEVTKKCAEQADEYLSDYIRKAVELRNAGNTTVHSDFIARHEKNKIEHPEMYDNPVTQQKRKDVNKAISEKETIAKKQANVKPIKYDKVEVTFEKQENPTMVKSFMKGGK